MVWIQSIVCSLLFIANVAWHPRHAGLAVALNLLLAFSCVWLLITKSGAKDVDLAKSNRDVARNIIIGGLILLYLVASVAKINGSSTALWRSRVDKTEPNVGLIVGTPKHTRSDEWFVHTPWILSQTGQTPAFPVSNPNIGNGVAPLVTNLPARHWTVLFRPQMWGFFFLDPERAFAFNWNFKWFALLLGAFLFLRTVANGSNFLALSGALILLFSGYTQWFFSTPTCMPEMIAMVLFGLWAAHIMRETKSPWGIAAAALVLVAAIEQFAFCCYPRFQVPLFYLALALLIAGSTSYRGASGQVGEGMDSFRTVCLVAALLVAAALLWQWYREVGPTIHEIQNLVYPGQLTFSGGAYFPPHLLAPFLEFAMTADHYPRMLGNASEASGFLFFAPLLAALVIRDAWQRRADRLLIALVVFLGLVIWFMAVGVPTWLARATGWSYVSSWRAMVAIGVATIIGVVRHLSLARAKSEYNRVRFLTCAVALALLLFGCFYWANSRMGNFAGITEVIAAAIFFAAVSFLIWRREQVASCVLLLIPLVYAYGLVNPIGQGLPGITQSPTFEWLSRLHERDPGARWMVIGSDSLRSCSLAQFVKATGANVLGGTRCMPDPEALRVLDPQNRYGNVHQRYSHICFVTSREAEPVFELINTDNYHVRVPFEAELFRRLQVEYVLVVDQGDIAILPGFERIAEHDGCVLLRRLAAR